jgi:transcriptional regulator with XRE-family HTH domain
MTDSNQTAPSTPWLALRQATGLTQREVERRLGWFEVKRGRLSRYERGLVPSPEEERQLRAFYGSLLAGETR